MKLYSLLKNIKCRVVGNSVVEIKGLYHNDTEVKEGGLFFCLRGTRVDGVNFVKSAIKNGAVAIVVESEIANLSGVCQVVVKDAREAMSRLACKFFGDPASKLKIIGVTGTNGKTTITNMLKTVLDYAGHASAVVGTNGVYFKGFKYDTGMTTPDPIELQRYFAMMVKHKVEYVCMEVSAHAIDLKKLCGVSFVACIFTNLTEDHLDYFKTMDNYFEAKSKIFARPYTNFAVVCGDDLYGQKLAQRINIPFCTYAINNQADYVADDLCMVGAGQNFVVRNTDFKINMAGKFNVLNALSVVAVLSNLGFDITTISQGLETMVSVEGRFNAFDIDGKLVVVDYAHTPDGLKNVLQACREIVINKKLFCVFGCGGNREKEKRSVMGKIASSLADFSVITTDNPRYEKREDIARDIEMGFENKNYIIELDRSKAIKFAIELAGEGDVVLIAGKGAEKYIDENGIKLPYCDLVEVEKYRR